MTWTKRARSICSFCGADTGPSDTAEDSHGVCPKCMPFAEHMYFGDPLPDQSQEGLEEYKTWLEKVKPLLDRNNGSRTANVL